MPVAEVYKGFIIGKGGATLNRIQAETGAKIQLPRSAREQMVIQAPSASALVAAKESIAHIIAHADRVLPPSHFLSLPLLDSGFLGRVEQFRREVIDRFKGKAQGLEESVLIVPRTMHVTVFMLKLFTPERAQAAARLLQECAPLIYDAVGTRSLVVRLQGLEIMNDDPAAVDVLYVRVHDADPQRRPLEALCRLLRSKFRDAGYGAGGTESDMEIGKIHATLLNTKHRAGAGQRPFGQGGGRGGNSAGRGGGRGMSETERVPVDCRGILEAFGQRDFGSVRIPAVHISIRGDKDPRSGFYPALGTVNLP